MRKSSGKVWNRSSGHEISNKFDRNEPQGNLLNHAQRHVLIRLPVEDRMGTDAGK